MNILNLTLALLLLTSLSYGDDKIEDSGSGTITYEEPSDLAVRLAALSNLEKLYDLCAVTDTKEITEEQLACMEKHNPDVIAQIALQAKRDELFDGVTSLGAYVTHKNKNFSGLETEMTRCGITVPNKAIEFWKMWEAGDASILPCLQQKKADTVAEKGAEDAIQMAKKLAKDAAKEIDCSRESGNIKIICNALQVLLN